MNLPDLRGVRAILPAYAGTNSSRAASPSVKSLGTGGVRGRDNLSSERFPSPRHIVFPNVPLQPEKPGGVGRADGLLGGGDLLFVLAAGALDLGDL